jgi:FAD binding domain/Ring hydroxylating alpha subunit (catalytic domain)
MVPQYSSASSYRIRPLGPEETLFEVWSLTRYPADRSPAKPTPPEPLAPDDPSWPTIPAQDVSNLPRQQKGLHAKGFEFMRLSNQIEGLISNFERGHRRLSRRPAIRETRAGDSEDEHHDRRADRQPRAHRTSHGMVSWDKSVDLLIAGSGGGGMVAGGFGHNADMRRRYSGDQPNEAKWSIANAGDTGAVLQSAMGLGAKTDLLDEAWWLPMVFISDPGAASLGVGRQRPGAIYVDSTGRRFCNESNSYVEVGKAMYANKAVPCWQIFDEGYVARYVSGANPLKKRRLPEALIEQGAIKRADTIGDLARQIDVAADELEHTIKRFNEFAAKGLDPDFGRGQSAYNDCLGDPGYRPNAAIGPLDRAPYYATRIFPADVGTCGGVITNEHAQVLDENDQVTTATVMGRTYPGAGASIANTMVFGYVAARHAAGRKIAEQT